MLVPLGNAAAANKHDIQSNTLVVTASKAKANH
jgi:hypothetical protein